MAFRTRQKISNVKTPYEVDIYCRMSRIPKLQKYKGHLRTKRTKVINRPKVQWLDKGQWCKSWTSSLLRCFLSLILFCDSQSQNIAPCNIDFIASTLACNNHLVYIAWARCMRECGFNYNARLSIHPIIIVVNGVIIIAWHHFIDCESQNKIRHRKECNSDKHWWVSTFSNLCTFGPLMTFVLLALKWPLYFCIFDILQ